MTQLPELFSELTQYMDQWGLPTEHERLQARLTTSIEEQTEFFNAMLPHMRAIITMFDEMTGGTIPDDLKPLSYAALAMCELDNSVNKWGKPELDTGIDIRRLTPKADMYDRAL